MKGTETEDASTRGSWLPRLLIAGLAFTLGALIFGPGDSADESTHAHAEEDDHGENQSQEAEFQSWTCAMHPQIRQPESGLCPICAMDLVPVSEGTSSSTSDAESNKVTLSPRAQALAKLRTTEVRRQANASADMRLLGHVEANEGTLKTVTAWTGGRIDKLHVNTTGQRIRAGQVIATLYSPEVYAAHQDLIVAKRQVERLANSPESSRLAAEAALNASKERLRLLGVPEKELAKMEGQKQPIKALAIRSAFSGTVIERLATEGAYLSTGAPLYRLTNLRSLWVQLEAYESDLPQIRLGQPVEVHVHALPGETFEGKITFIDPTLDHSRRTTKVRVQVSNPKRKLRPGMFAEAKFIGEKKSEQDQSSSESRSPLVIPASAPLFTGRRALVYVEHRDEDKLSYEARTVRLGPRLGEFYPVVAGLSEHEKVVSRGAFALDADLQIRGGAGMMASPDDSQDGIWDEAINLKGKDQKRLEGSTRAYIEIQQALAEDDLDASKKAAEQLRRAARKTDFDDQKAQVRWKQFSEKIVNASLLLARSDSLESARSHFETLTKFQAAILQSFGNPLDEKLHIAFCPMAMGSEGATWIQQGDTIDNAYFGESMRRCGEIKSSIDPGSYLEAPLETRASSVHSHEGHQH